MANEFSKAKKITKQKNHNANELKLQAVVNNETTEESAFEAQMWQSEPLVKAYK